MRRVEALVGRKRPGGERLGAVAAYARGIPRGPRLLLASLLLLMAAFVWLVSYGYSPPAPGEELSLDQVYALAAENRIHAVELLDEDSQLVGKTCVVPPPTLDRQLESAPVGRGDPAPPPPPCSGPVADFHAAYPGSDVATQQLIEVLTTTTGAKVVVDKQTDVAVVRLLATYIFPLLLLANLFGLIFMWRGGDGMLGDIAGLGSMRRRRQRQQQAGSAITFEDVGGAEQAVAELREVTDYLTHPKTFEAYQLAPPKGMMLLGPPGCGKGLIVQAVAGETGRPLFWVSGRELVQSLAGVGAARVRDLFAQVRAEAPAIVFIDEIDVLASRGGGGGSPGGEDALNQLLVEMDCLEVDTGIVVIAAANRPAMLDPALLRPGRFDRHVIIDLPHVSAREAILKLHARSRPIAEDVDFGLLAEETPGLTGADLAALVNRAEWLALDEGGGDSIESSHLLEALQHVLHASDRHGRLMSAEERKRLAVHHSGHAVVTAALGRNDELQRVSIMSRTRSFTRTRASSEDALPPATAKDMKDQLAMAMGGIAAEELIFGEASTIGESDIGTVTDLTRQMVGLYGMSSSVGRLRIPTRDDGHLASSETPTTLSGRSSEQFEREVKGLIAEAERTANMLVLRHRTDLEGMSLILESEESLEGPALQARLARIRNGQHSSVVAQQHPRHPAHGYRLWGDAAEQTTESQRSDSGG
ncbi:MAG: AAA family ATPase [Actinomycetota bacterium]|nr:AAA family ATPase [Actinomycetota bacterium]